MEHTPFKFEDRDHGRLGGLFYYEDRISFDLVKNDRDEHGEDGIPRYDQDKYEVDRTNPATRVHRRVHDLVPPVARNNDEIRDEGHAERIKVQSTSFGPPSREII